MNSISHYNITALMPGGDHCNIIDPPGLTVMRIVGGRYRVTAAHRVVWTWMNEFLPDPIGDTTTAISPSSSTSMSSNKSNRIQFGDLVTMTIVDVFETDLDGKLLSYCPTFDNRSVCKTIAAVETFRKETHKIVERVNIVRQSETGKKVERVRRFFVLSGRFFIKSCVLVYFDCSMHSIPITSGLLYIIFEYLSSSF